MTVQHVYRFAGCLICFFLGYSAHLDWADGYRFSIVAFGLIALYVAYLVATTEVKETSALDKTGSIACQGVMGKLFGHKFTKLGWEQLGDNMFCYRCGAPAGHVITKATVKKPPEHNHPDPAYCNPRCPRYEESQ